MGNLATLQPNVFSNGNQPANRGRKKGVPNRATVYKNILKLKTKIKTPDGEEKDVTLYEAIALGQAKSAMKGNTNAWKEIQDSIHGKMTEKSEVEVNANVRTSITVQGVKGNDGPGNSPENT